MPDYQQVFNNALNLHKEDKLEEAIKLYEEILSVHPDHPQTLSNLGAAYCSTKEYHLGISCFRKALKSLPNSETNWVNLGNAYQELALIDQAEKCYKQTLKINPRALSAYEQLIKILSKEYRCQEAKQYIEQGLKYFPNDYKMHENMAFVLQKEGKTQDGLAYLERGLEIKPGPETEFKISALLFELCHLERAWQCYEGRWTNEKLIPTVEKLKGTPLWQGEDLNGKAILIHFEQGFGDMIQFARYIPLLAEKFPQAKVLFRNHDPLVDLFKKNFPQVTHFNQKATTFDFPCHYWCPLISLARHFKTTTQNVPSFSTPYIKNYWPRKLKKSQEFSVGIVWQGRKVHTNDKHRSMHLKLWKDILQIDKVRFVSLQYDQEYEEILDSYPWAKKVIKTNQLIENFTDTASLIDDLDLIISVDTAIVHLAAAMGKDVWVFLPFVADWRWGGRKSDSYWYKSVKLFRQNRAMDWQKPIEELIEKLKLHARRT